MAPPSPRRVARDRRVADRQVGVDAVDRAPVAAGGIAAGQRQARYGHVHARGVTHGEDPRSVGGRDRQRPRARTFDVEGFVDPRELGAVERDRTGDVGGEEDPIDRAWVVVGGGGGSASRSVSAGRLRSPSPASPPSLTVKVGAMRARAGSERRGYPEARAGGDPRGASSRCEFPPLSRTVNPVTSTVSIQTCIEPPRTQRNSMTRHAWRGHQRAWALRRRPDRYRKSAGRQTTGGPNSPSPDGYAPGPVFGFLHARDAPSTILESHKPLLRGVPPLPRALRRTLSPRFAPHARRRNWTCGRAPSTGLRPLRLRRHAPGRAARCKRASSSERRCAGSVRAVHRRTDRPYLSSSS